jgi:hypothetical protein
MVFLLPVAIRPGVWAVVSVLKAVATSSDILVIHTCDAEYFCFYP